MLDTTRITDLEEATEVPSGAYILIESPTLGTRKISIENLEGGE